MVVDSTKYVANVDFSTVKVENGHKIHLNPYPEGSAFRRRILKHYDPNGV